MSSSEQPFNKKTSSENELLPSITKHKNETIAIQSMEKSSTDSKEGCGCGNKSNNMTPRQYIYAIGKIVYRFPNKSVEMELVQAIGRIPEGETKSLTNLEVAHEVFTDPNNRYLARQICYILNIEGLETYILVPGDPLDIDRFAQALRPAPDVGDIDVIIGRRGPMASPEMCNGLVVPVVIVDQIYSFDRATLMKAIPKRKEKSANEDQFRKTADAVFSHLIQIADNAGAIDEHRALNYLAVRYDEIYHRTQLLQDENYSFIGIEVRPSLLSGTQKIVDVIFSYENRANRALQKWFCRVDVTNEWPYLVSPIREYFER
jgi:cyclic patellamide precursor peptide PatG